MCKECVFLFDIFVVSNTESRQGVVPPPPHVWIWSLFTRVQHTFQTVLKGAVHLVNNTNPNSNTSPAPVNTGGTQYSTVESPEAL